MGELLLLVLGFFAFGSKKNAQPDDVDDVDASKLPGTAPSWSGYSGHTVKINFWARRQKEGWVSNVDGIGRNTHATAYLALRAALTGAHAMGTGDAPMRFTANPYVFDGLATYDNNKQLWRWYVKLPAADKTTITGSNDALANGEVGSADEAIDELLAWARPVTEGRRP